MPIMEVVMFAYKNLSEGTYEQAELEKLYKAARGFQEIRISESFLFYKSFIRVKYVDLNHVKKIFLRVESGESGDFPTQTVYVILTDLNEKEISLHMERMDTAKQMLEFLKEQYPTIQYGFTK